MMIDDKKLEKKFEPLVEFLSTFITPKQLEDLKVNIFYAGEYGHGIWYILGLLHEHQHPIPQSIYNQIATLGKYFDEASKELGYRDVSPDMWESLQPLVISDEEYQSKMINQ